LHRDTNPLVDTLPNAVRPIIKDYRIDRANQISATGPVRPFISEQQYFQMNKNYLPGAAMPASAAVVMPASTVETVTPVAEANPPNPPEQQRMPEREADINEVHQKALDFLDAAHSLVRKGRTAAVPK
jgi:hypothetical protein